MLRFKEKEAGKSTFKRPDNMHPIVYELLARRGIDSVEAAERFLHPSAEGLHDPMLLHDMKDAAAVISAHVKNGDRICVYGDYDADGVCSCTVMSVLLNKMGADYEVYIPSRHDEGYGLNMQAVEKIAADGVSLLVTVDCGISCHAEIERAKELGMQCIVTDHHRPGEILPDCPVVDPLLGGYPFKWLCGAGVAFKLTEALLGRKEALDVADIAAIATIGDIVSLTDENRCIVRLGLDAINRSPRPGVLELMKISGVADREIKSGDISFSLVPRINAIGRVASARTAYELLMAEEEFEAATAADALEQANRKRKDLQELIGSQAICQLQELDISAHSIILVRGKDWNHGIIGLAAAQLQKIYNYPIIVFTEKDGYLTGSCRSIPGVDIFKALSSCADLMVKFGGHSQAAGLTIEAKDFETLWERLDAYIAENVSPECYIPVQEYDLELPLKELDLQLVDALDALEPFGSDNPQPVFRVEVSLLEKRAVGSGGKHLQLIASDGTMRVKGICFGEGAMAKDLADQVDILYSPTVNEWQGNRSAEMRISAIRNADPLSAVSGSEADNARHFCDFLTEIVYNKKHTFKHDIRCLTVEELAKQLNETVAGICIICVRTETAAYWLRRLGERIDFSAGAFPADRTGFNAVVLCPNTLDDIPASVHTAVFADFPAPDIPGASFEIFALGDVPANMVSVPDIDEMREVYKAARRLAGQPMWSRTIEDLDLKLAEASGYDVSKCTLSRLALMDMHLLEIRYARSTSACELIVPRPVKTDPLSSAVWRSICDLKSVNQ